MPSRVSGWWKIIWPIQLHDISKTRRTILLLLGEKAGLRASVQTILVTLWVLKQARIHSVQSPVLR